MTNSETLDVLLYEFIAEKNPTTAIQLPEGLIEKRNLLRTLMNTRPPLPAYSVSQSTGCQNCRDKRLRLAAIDPGQV